MSGESLFLNTEMDTSDISESDTRESSFSKRVRVSTSSGDDEGEKYELRRNSLLYQEDFHNQPGSSHQYSALSQLKLSPHPMYCDETAEHLNKMDKRILLAKQIDPEYLNKCFKLPIYTELIGFGFFGDIKMLRPLHHAAAWGHLKCVKKLIEAGVKADIVTSEGFNAIHFAIYHGYRNGEDEKNNELVKYLIKNNVTPIVVDRKPQFNKTYLIDCCVCRNNIEMLRILLENGIPLEEFIVWSSGEIYVPDKDTPLILAIKYYKLEAFTLLLYHGAKLVWYPSQYNRRVSYYSILHFCLRNYKNPNLILSVFEIYQQFGGNMWIQDSIASNNTDGLLLNSVMAESNKLENVIDEIQDMICNPMRLQNMCRLVIKNRMGRKYWCNVDMLPLPCELKEFLKYSDLLEH